MTLNLVILQVQNFFIPGLKILKNIGVGDLCRNYAGLEYVTLQRNKFLHWNFSRFLTTNFRIATNPVKTNFANLVETIRYAESAKWHAQRAHVLYLSYVPTRHTCSTCPACPRAQVYFTDCKIKKWKLYTHTFLRVLSLIQDLNFAISQQKCGF